MSHFVITVAFCNKKPNEFCNKPLSHFVISAAFCDKVSKGINYETVTLLTLKIRILMLMLCPPMLFSHSTLESGGEEPVYFYQSPWTHTPKRFGIFT